jgi:ribosome-binding factor A
MNIQKDEKIKEVIRETVSEFLARESNRTSLITVTGVELSARGSKAKVLITVLPEHQADAAIDFITRRLSDIREYVGNHVRMMRVPFIEVGIDVGEKNRQRIDEIEQSL